MALSVRVEIEVDLFGEPGEIEHRTVDGEARSLRPADRMTDLTAAVVSALVPDGGVRVRVLSQAPLRSGIGGSSSYGIGLARALAELVGRIPSDDALVRLVRDLEARVLGVPTGEQDHWAALKGGVLALHLEPGGNRVEPLDVDERWLGERATVYFSGIRHHSGMVNWKVIRRRLDGDRSTRRCFDEIAAAARSCRAALLAGDEATVAAAIRREWRARRRLAPEVSPDELEQVIAVAEAHGATAVKACGAGGGGSVLLWHPPGARASIVEALDRAVDGGRLLAVGTEIEGCRRSGNP
jgi:D-glycero-alpha-D-manno-heptose-7-phosphate kinase